MPTYKLTYFNLKGLAELIRWIFAQAGVEYEDIRITQEQWAEMKSTTPNGSVPILEVDGKVLAGSGPIARYVAEQHGLAGENDFENAQIAGIDDLLTDTTNRLAKYWIEKDEAVKEQLKKDLNEKHLPFYFTYLEKQITTNAAPEGWLFGKKVTYVDLRLATMLEYTEMVSDKILESYPGIMKLKESVFSLPKIAQWIKDRPKTDV